MVGLAGHPPLAQLLGQFLGALPGAAVDDAGAGVSAAVLLPPVAAQGGDGKVLGVLFNWILKLEIKRKTERLSFCRKYWQKYWQKPFLL